MNELTPRGTSVCRGCGLSSLASVLDLGEQPLANELALSQDSLDPLFPLHLRVCDSCGLGQVGEYVLPERIFGAEYPYLSSVSQSWVAHAGRFIQEVIATLSLRQADLVMEVASNDGYLLEQMQAAGPQVLGIEPSEGVANIARAKGVPTVTEFFGLRTAERLVEEHGRPRLVVANNVMAHVPDLTDFTAGLAHLCDDATVITVENPSLVTMLEEGLFDTIYHEHFSYLTAHAVARMLEPVGLELVRVEQLTTHGGSNRYWLALAGSHEVAPSVQETIQRELETGLLSGAAWEGFANRSHEAIDGLRKWLDARRRSQALVAGYGAAAKGNTLMNAAGVSVRDLVVVVDGSLQKQGKFLPGSHIPVAEPAELSKHAIDDVLILPWNIATEIAPLVREISPRSTSWVGVPTMRAVE